MSSIGDVVLTEPVVAAIREAKPDAAIGFVVKERFRDLITGNPDVSAIHTLPDSSLASVLSLAREIRRQRYSVVIDLHRNVRSRFLRALCGAAVTVQYAKRDPGDWCRVRLARGAYRASKRIVERYLDALAPLGMDCRYRTPRFHPEGEAVAWAERFLDERGLPPGGFVAVAPGSVWPTKRWPADRYSALTSRLAGGAGLPVMLFGSPAERELCERVAADSGATVVAGRATLGQAAALLGMARVCVGNDSGPTHLAMASGTPTVAIFGPTDPGQFDFSGHVLVHAGLPCSACSFFGSTRCRAGHWDCMLSLSVEDVLESVRGLLNRRPEP